MNRLQLFSVAALGAVCLLNAAAADEGPQGERDAKALEILAQVDAAAKKVNAVSYHTVTTPTGVALARGGPAEGDVVLAGWAGSLPERFLVTVRTTRQDRPIEITGGGNGELFFVIDHAAKKAYADMDPGVFGGHRGMLLSVAMIEFVHDAPFSDELNAPVVRYAGEEEVAGQPCHVIHVEYGPSQQSTWYFAKADWLPRRRIQKFVSPQGEGGFDRVISQLEIDPAVEASRFVMKLPEGYEQIDDFAP